MLSKQVTAKFCASADEVLTVRRQDGQLALWPLAALQQDSLKPVVFNGLDPARWVIGLSPDCRWIAAVKGETVELWSREHPERVPVVLAGHKGAIRSLSFSPDSRWLLTASADRTARAWSLDTQGLEFVVLPGATAGLYSAVFDGEGKRIATGSGDGYLGLWTFDAASRSVEPLVSLRRHAEAVNNVEFSLDRTQILSASDDGTVRLGDCKVCTADTGQLREMVRTMAHLSAPEMAEIVEARRVSWTDLGWRKRTNARP